MAVWLIIGPWMMSGATELARWNDVAAGLLVLGLTLPRGAVHDQYGGWNRFVR